MQAELTERQQEIVLRVVEEYVATGQPVGSKSLVERFSMQVSSSTVRNELADLEQLGLLTHPHTSAGRVPTDLGYRLYAQWLLDRLDTRPPSFALDLTEARTEVDVALQQTTELLSRATRLLALVSAPPIQSETVRHVEVLLLQPDVVMIVLITSGGAVTKRIAAFDEPVDPGLASWARQYLNEQLVGVQLGTRLVRQRLDDPSLSAVERAFVERLSPAFTESAASEEQRLFVGGAAGLLDDVGRNEMAAYRGLLELLERRRALLDVLAAALDPRRPFVRVGEEIGHPALHELALVGAAYGLSNRPLGAVTLVGPTRMDYENAIRSVRAAASELSRFAEERFGED
jgi:heat-inducible transcriptional repressor